MEYASEVQVIFETARNIESENARNAYLDSSCRDTAVRQRVEELLAAYGDAQSFLESPPSGIDLGKTSAMPLAEKPGTQIGPFKLLQQIGEGGMGAVFMAEQKQPVKRRVALKVIKPGMDTRQVIARFEAERQALAMMDHPNIARVLDAGSTDSGRPYFVMELVNGAPITEYCDEKKLSLRERLELFLPVCRAVQHAHQKGIIHRDLKPSNILVARYDGRPVPKVIDFGVARAANQNLTEKTLFTEFGQIVGTLDYMSPEQAERNQLDIDTRSDVYSLGVVLYELLVGEVPFDRQRLRSAAWDEMLRIIREEEPPRPSIRLSSSGTAPSIAANRSLEPAKLGTLVRGELDWIVMKALEKDRSRRFETANQFAEDIEHYLLDEPVQACPPSTRYKLGKFVRRNQALIVTYGAIVAALLFGGLIALVQANHARIERDRAIGAEALAKERLAVVDRQNNEIREAKRRADRAAQEASDALDEAVAIRQFLTDDLLGLAGNASQIDAGFEPDPNIQLRTVVDRATKQIEDRFDDNPAIKAKIYKVLGDIHTALGDYQKAGRMYEAAVELDEDDAAEAVVMQLKLATAKRKQERFQEAESMYRHILSKLLNGFPLGHPIRLETLNGLAILLNEMGRFRESEELHREVLALRDEGQAPDHVRLLHSKNNLAQVLHRQGRHVEAESMLREVLADKKQALGEEDPSTLTTKSSLASVLVSRGMLDEAEELYREALQALIRVVGEKHPKTLTCKSSLANCRLKQGKAAEAKELWSAVLEVTKRTWGNNHLRTADAKSKLANALRESGKAAQAVKLDRESLAIRLEVLGEQHFRTTESMNNLGLSLHESGRTSDAEDLFRRAIKTKQNFLGRSHPASLASLFNLANVLSERGERVESKKLYEECLSIGSEVFRPQHPFLLGCQHNLAFLLRQIGSQEAAEKILKKKMAILQEADAPLSSKTLNSIFLLGLCLADQDKNEEAEKYLRDASEGSRRVLGDDDLSTLGRLSFLAGWQNHTRQFEEAEITFRQVIKAYKRILGPEHRETLRRESGLAAVFENQEHLDEAEQLYTECYSKAKDALGQNDPDTINHKRALSGFLSRRITALVNAIDEPDGNLKELARLAGIAADLDPESVQAWKVLGLAYYRRGDFESALNAFDTINALSQTDDQENGLRIAMTLWQLGKSEEALAHYTKTIAWLAANNSTPAWLGLRDEAEKLLRIDAEQRESPIKKRQKED